VSGIVLTATLGAASLTACSAPSADMPRIPERCPQVKEISAQKVDEFVSTTVDALESIRFLHASATAPLVIRVDPVDEPTPEEMGEAFDLVSGTFRCARLAVSVGDRQGLLLARAMELGEVDLTVNSVSDSGEVHAFGALRHKVAIRTRSGAINWSRVAVEPGVKEFALSGYSDISGWSEMPDVAEKLPNVETLSLSIDRTADWDWQHFEGFGSLKHLNVNLGSEDDPLGGISTETLRLVLRVQEALPELETLNGVNLTNGEVTAEMLGVGSTQSRAEIKAEDDGVAAEFAAESALKPWVDQVRGGGYSIGGPVDSITGPIVIQGTGNSVHAGAYGLDFEGIPAAKLCPDTEHCASVVVVDFRQGEEWGTYTRSDGGIEPFPGYKGETYVQVYNAGAKTVTEPIVVATTLPSQYWTNRGDDVGKPDYEAAYAWIAEHTK
jgi:hypothetical protein